MSSGLIARSAAAALALCLAPPALAAQVTDVPDAADGEDLFDANLELKFDVLRKTSLITRENVQTPENEPQPRAVPVRELDFERLRMRLRPRLEVGIFHDLSTFIEWPIVLWDQRSTRYTDGTTSSNSTLVRDRQPRPAPVIDGWPQRCGSGGGGTAVDGNDCWGFPAGPYNDWAFDDNGQWQSVRAGFDYPQVGVRWSPVNNERDPSKPTITLQADYNFGFLPLPIHDPEEDAATEEDPGPVAQGKHQFHFQIGMSKRFLLLDPFFVVDAYVPFAASDAYPGLTVYPYGGFTLGMEIVPYENTKLHQKFAVQLSVDGQYMSEGRDYVEISDALGELTYRDDYFTTGLNLGLYFQAFEFGFVNVVGSAAYETPHYITAEDIGTDNDEEGDLGYGVVDLDVTQGERNQYFNPSYDTPGRRFRVEDGLRLELVANLAVTF